MRGERFDGAAFLEEAFAKGACAAVVGQGGASTEATSARPLLRVDDALEALQRFAAWHRGHYRIPILALTGSCGKTTTKDMTAALLETKFRIVKTPGNLNNEIGCPLSLLGIDETTDFAVIEMGANHAGEIARLCAIARPTESAITMIGPAHLEGFGTVENVAKAKAEIVSGLPEDGVFYVNGDDARCRAIAESFGGRKVVFGGQGDVRLLDCGFDADGWMRLDVAPIGTLRLPLACRAHAQNALLAIAVGLEHGVEEFEGPLAAAAQAAARFKVLEIGPLLVIDDSYNANPSSMAAALEALAERPEAGASIAALGSMFELGDAAEGLHREVATLAGRLGVHALFVMGAHGHAMIEAAREAGVPHTEFFDDPLALARAVQSIASPGDAVLVKGSRGMRMERVVDSLRELYE